VLPGRIAVGDKELRWPTLAEVFEEKESAKSLESLETLETLETTEPQDTAISEGQDTLAPKPKPVIPKVPVDSVTDSRMFLAAFYASLTESSDRVVRVVHYGDSQIEEDRMSQQIREKLQTHTVDRVAD
jgi:hypothetical protein